MRSVLSAFALAALGAAVAAATGPIYPLTDVEIDAIERALDDERHSEAIYALVVADHGDVRPFDHIAEAEARHSSFLETLIADRFLAPSDDPWPRAEELPHYGSVDDACAAAIDLERANVELYDSLLALDLPDDVRAVFEHNRRASLEHHLPAFERCASRAGARYGATSPGAPGRHRHGSAAPGPTGDRPGRGATEGCPCPHCREGAP